MLYEKIEFAPNVPLKYRLISLEEYPFHMHSNALEIIFVVEGDIELSAVNTVIQMKEGDIYIASPNEIHYLLGKGKSKTSIVQIYLNISAYKGEFPDINSYQFANGDLEKNSQGIRILGNHIIKALTRFFNEDRKEINYYKEGAEIIKILVRHFQCYNIVKYYPEISDAFKGNEVQLSRIRHIVDYIYMNCSKPIRIEDVANMEHISTSYLTYILKIGCGMGFRMFLNMARVQKSAAMLLEDEMSMQKIAYECGFSKYEYYNATFKKVFRITPKQYKSKFITKTIANLPIRVRELTYENLKELTKKFYVRHEEIVLDLNEKHTAKDFILPNCINLPCLQYDHIYHYQFLKSVKSGLAVDTIGMTLCFWNRYKNRPHVLKSILIDLWKPGYSIRVYLDERTDIEELKSFICFINGFLETQPLDMQNKIEFAVKSDGKDGFDACEETCTPNICKETCTPNTCKELFDFVSDMHFNVFFIENNSFSIEKLDEPSDYLLCSVLKLILKQKNVLNDNIVFFGEKQISRAHQLAFLSENGVRYPLYYLFWMLKHMGRIQIKQGNGYIITKKRKAGDTGDISVLIYDPVEFDNYFSGREGEIRINNLFGDFALKTYRFSPYEYMKKFEKLSELTDKMLSDELMDLIDRSLSPESSVSIIKSNGTYKTMFKIEPREILLLSFEKLRA